MFQSTVTKIFPMSQILKTLHFRCILKQRIVSEFVSVSLLDS